MAHRLVIGRISVSTPTDSFRRLFAQAGTVESAAVVIDRDIGRPRGFAFVETASAGGASQAIRRSNDGCHLKDESAWPSRAGDGARRSDGGGRW